MSELLREGLEARLAMLNDLLVETLGAPSSDAPIACATCFALEDECFCPAPVMWPLSAVVHKLRAELALSS
jgi:hypothetical protein